MTTISFLDLPGEIRNHIYHLLFILPSFPRPKLLNNHRIYPEVLSTCRKIYAEAVQILYGCNTFIAHTNLLTGLPRLRLNFGTISRPNLISMIRRYHICVRLDCDPNFSAKKARESFTGVEELTIEVFQAQFGSSDYTSLKLFEEIRGVKKARIFGSVSEFPGYVSWLENTMMAVEGCPILAFGVEEDEHLVRPYDLWIDGGR